MGIVGLIGILLTSGALTGTLGWIFGKKKSDADVKKTSAETDALAMTNLKSTIGIYKMVHDDLAEQLKIVSLKCTSLSDEMEKMRKDNSDLQEEIKKLRAENFQLQKEISYLTNQLQNMKS
jgi:uncharacterized protein YlxW (UPF0749 family)